MRGVGKYYNPDLDYTQKIEEMRADWEVAQAQKADEKAGGWEDEAVDDSVWSSDVSSYFEKTRVSPMVREKGSYESSPSPERTL